MENTDELKSFTPKNQHDGSKWAGIILVCIGSLILLKKMGIYIIPDFLFSWPSILIIIGLFVGIKHQFKGPGWLIMIIIGGVFLWGRLVHDLDLRKFIAPAIIIGIGTSMILRPRNKSWSSGKCNRRYSKYQNTTADNSQNTQNTNSFTNTTSSTDEEYLEGTFFLSGARKVLTSKNFKGGTITCFMGGMEIDLSQADIQEQAVLNISATMGGAQLIVPADWELRNEIKPFLGGVDDKRKVNIPVINNRKLLILKGTAFMGGVEISNY